MSQPSVAKVPDGAHGGQWVNRKKWLGKDCVCHAAKTLNVGNNVQAVRILVLAVLRYSMYQLYLVYSSG